MSSIPARITNTPEDLGVDVTALIPDFPFNYGNYLSTAKKSKKPLAYVSDENYGKRVAIVGGGISGVVAAYEIMRMGLYPVIFESSGEIGGRMKTLNSGVVPTEMGAMRYPPSAKALFYYFKKTGMTGKMAPFPNPGTSASTGTVIDFLGKRSYFEADSKQFPIPAQYKNLGLKWQKLLDAQPFNYETVIKLMTEGSIDQKKIKSIWNQLLYNSTTKRSYDDSSFHDVLVESGWDFSTIELFGQVGFGSGGWNTDYVNSFLEILRVVYTALDSDHKLMYDGSRDLSTLLYEKSPSYFDDSIIYFNPDITVKTCTEKVLTDPKTRYYAEVNYIEKLESNFRVEGNFNNTGENFSYTVDAVVYTPQVRVLQMFEGKLDYDRYKKMNTDLFNPDLREAVNYTHYMQSSKTFVQAKTPFWKERDSSGKYLMSTTLSDRLTRGTYLLDYTPVNKGACICLSYTWNDDSLKFIPFDKTVRFNQTMNIIKDLYPSLDFDDLLLSDRIDIISWEKMENYIGAFKNNLPGQYEYQRRLFSQFMDGIEKSDPNAFILAGDDISWTAGWAEGGVTTALNAVNKIAKVFNGRAYEDNPGPIDTWDEFKPLKINK